MSWFMLRSVGIHDGTFHADEVTACALLIVFDLIDEELVTRTRDPKVLDTCEYVCDVGGVYDPAKKLFDHHQATYQGELSSAGMILRYLKEQKVMTQEAFDHLNQMLVLGVDAHDNGRSKQEVGVCTFSHVIANFNPIAYDADEHQLDAAFRAALTFTIGHVRRCYERYQYNLSCRALVKEAMERGGSCLFFDRALPWLENFFALDGEAHEALFVVMPAGEHWKVRGIPPNYAERMQVRRPLPEKWAGLLGEELVEASGIEGAVFCHKGRFTSVWETKEAAMKALHEILGEDE